MLHRLILTGSISLLAANEAVPVTMIDPLARLGAVGVLGFIAIWMVTKEMPANRKTLAGLTEAIKELRQHCRERSSDK